jgi:uncharacterized membrane protein (DUF2068 family)
MMTEPLEEQRRHAQPATAAGKNCLPEKGKTGHHAPGLLVIGLFKLLKALFFAAVGIGALRLVHRNVGDELLKVASMLHLDPDGRFIDILQDKADLISGHKLRQLSLYTFLYAALSLVEGVGLMMEKTWAEYLTLGLTIGALPLDTYALIDHPTPIHAGVVVINLAVLAYLLWFIQRYRQKRAQAVTDQAD